MRRRKLNILQKGLIVAGILGIAGLMQDKSNNKVTLPKPIDLSIPIKGPVEIINDLGRSQADNAIEIQKEATRAIKNHRPMRNVLRNDEQDMPPWEHTEKWGYIRSNKGECWYHNDTMRKVCR